MVHFLNRIKILKESHDSYDTNHHFQIVNPKKKKKNVNPGSLESMF